MYFRATALAEARAIARTHTSFLSSVFKELWWQAPGGGVAGAGKLASG